MSDASTPFFYDLSEILYAAAGRRKIYGVLRVIAEFGVELQHMDRGIRFVVWSPGHRSFFEVNADFSRLYDNACIDIGVPASAAPRPLRSAFHRYLLARRIAHGVASPLVRAINRSRWRRAGVRATRIDLAGATLFSAARPKFIVEYLPALQAAGTRLVAMLHDLIPMHEDPQSPRYVNFCGDTAAVLRASVGVLANSEFTRSEVLRFAARGLLPLPKSIAAVPLAHEFRAATGDASRPLPEGPYLLCVGAAPGHKNLEVIFDALALLARSASGIHCSLLLAGAPDRQVRTLLSRPELRGIVPRVVFFDDPDHAELAALYRHASAVVVPSRIEGWGLPAGESLWLGTPLVCASSPALLESGAGLALSFDPDSAAELAVLLERLATDPAFRQAQLAKIAAGRDRLRSWSQAAAELFAAVLACTKPAVQPASLPDTAMRP